MTSSKNTSKESLKDLYNESKKRIKYILNSLVKYTRDNRFLQIPDEDTCALLKEHSREIYKISQYESENQYREAIAKISSWMASSLESTFLEKFKNHDPNPLFILKKGAEILHSFLHRDLRRKQFSSEENEIYDNYLHLIKKMPEPLIRN